MTRWWLLLIGALVLLPSPVLAQTSPCLQTLTGVQVNPTTLYVELADFTVNEVDGQPRVNQAQFAMFAEGANPATATPVQGPSTLPRSAFTPVSGHAGCYQASLPGTVPTAQRLVGALKTQRTARGTVTSAESPWSAVSSPFGAAPSVLTAPGAPRIQ
jgi:hypothetical protein